MTQIGQSTPVNPHPPPNMASETQVQDAVKSAGSKRGRDDVKLKPTDGGDVEESARSPKRRKGQEVLFRIVVPSKQIGKVIGRVGSRIQKIREDTRATIKIADAIARHEERVIIISSKDNDDVICDAENALHQIVSLILKEDDSDLEALKVSVGHVAANTIRLLIAGSQAGSLIGISGQSIERLRNSSGATITVLAQSQLPLASAHESDRVVQISGDVPAVLKAVVEVGCQLRENPARQVISISPTYNLNIRTAQQYLDPTSADYITFEMVIPEAFIGGLIGRCGSNISRIRNESGATIKVHGGKGETKFRQIHFGGTSQQVALAKQRVDEYVYSQLIQQAGSQQAVDYQTGPAAALASLYSATPAGAGTAHPALPIHPPSTYYQCQPFG